MIAVVTCCHPELGTQVGASGVLVVPEVLSASVAVAQSWATESAQVTSYQNDSVVSPGAAVKVWMTSEFPLVSDVEPAMAAYFPECAPDDTIVVEGPLVDQPENDPVSNPPFTIGSAAWAAAGPDGRGALCTDAEAGTPAASPEAAMTATRNAPSNSLARISLTSSLLWQPVGGHFTVAGREPGWLSVWYNPPHEPGAN
jgi:hypothetical protein